MWGGWAVAAGGIGAVAGTAIARWCIRLTSLGESSVRADRLTRLLTPVLTAALFALFTAAMLALECQATPEVLPDPFWKHGRIVVQLALVALLVAATVTDFRDYVIPDAITLPGLAIGVLAATLSGDLQIVHLWVDWNAEIPGLRGPWIPDWLRRHPHLHGLAWSLAGAAVGAGATWLVRALSRLILGREALGFGDVTLMALIGSFLGWQPTLVAFLVAPLCGLAVGLAARLAGGRGYIPYGPYLAAGAIATLFAWRWIWMYEAAWSPTSRFRLRDVFGDGVALAILAGIALASLASLLGMLRLYQAIPGRRDEGKATRNRKRGGA